MSEPTSRSHGAGLGAVPHFTVGPAGPGGRPDRTIAEAGILLARIDPGEARAGARIAEADGMRVAVGTDHAGFDLKDTVLASIKSAGHEVVDVGAYEFDPEDDYPDFAEAVGRAVQEGRAERGIMVCGSAVGAGVAANKLRGIRASACHDTYSAHQGVEHDAMNVLCLGGRIVGSALAAEIVVAFLSAEFVHEDRFQRRLAKVTALEEAPGGIADQDSD